MPVHTLVVGELQTNCYVVHPDGAAACVVIDPGGDGSAVADDIVRRGLEPAMIVATHGHVDHIAGVAELKGRFPAIRVALLDVERPTYVRPTLNLSFFIGGSIKPPEPDMLMRDGQDLRVADMRFRVIHVPGHTPGGAALFGTIDGHNVLFTGDSLFAGSIGRTDFPGGNARQLIDGIRSRLLVLPDDTRVYPGHGPETTIAQERRDNPFLLNDL